MEQIHSILFNMLILYSGALGLWATVLAARSEKLSGNYWGAVATYVGVVGVTTLLGVVLMAQGMRPRDGRLWLYFLYMAFLFVIMPGLFSLLRGRDDRSAALSFAFLALFNAAVTVSLSQRGFTDWVDPNF